jgi:hypothetical protein
MKIKILAIALICIYSTSCALVFKGTKQEVVFGSDPQRAEVYVNGVRMGETPLTLKLVTRQTYAIEFRREGYKPKSVQVNNKVGAGWVVLDILTGLVPIVIDAATGAWYSLDQKNINMVLEKQQKKPIDPKDLEKFLY